MDYESGECVHFCAPGTNRHAGNADCWRTALLDCVGGVCDRYPLCHDVDYLDSAVSPTRPWANALFVCALGRNDVLGGVYARVPHAKAGGAVDHFFWWILTKLTTLFMQNV